MEIFIDFGLFELLAATGVAAVAKKIHERPFSRWTAIVLSVAAPAVLVFVTSTETSRWIAAIALATSLVNAIALAKAVGVNGSGVLPHDGSR